MAQSYTVKEGDTLYGIAEQFYGDGNEWEQIYLANQEVIGDNPDLILPGQQLTIPDQ
ncbi:MULTISPECIES: LysM peptidoglycan-binding domain-containing protein [unclassified Microcoleus]|uniref:LysM peptidoglycan-binding domain-containing protein n=1 Tax=unclassified Microcoleus TaxID=2642155 RepID=UPI002FD0D5E4